jgi:hypothetical protein
VNTLRNVLVDLDGLLGAHLALRVGRGSVVLCLERVKIRHPSGVCSDDSNEGKLNVLLEPGHSGADEPERARPVPERPVEQLAGELTDSLGVVDANRE